MRFSFDINPKLATLLAFIGICALLAVLGQSEALRLVIEAGKQIISSLR